MQLKPEFASIASPPSSLQVESSDQSEHEQEDNPSSSNAFNIECKQEHKAHEEGRSILFAHTQMIDKFIEVHAPPDRTLEVSSPFFDVTIFLVLSKMVQVAH